MVKGFPGWRGLRHVVAAFTLAGCVSSEPASFQIRLVSPDSTPDTEAILFNRSARGAQGRESLYVHRRSLLDGRAIKHASAVQSPYDGRTDVELTLTDEGAKQFAKLTRENIGKRLAMLVDGEIIVAPVVRTEIGGNRVMISGFWSDNEARDLAAKLNQAGSKK